MSSAVLSLAQHTPSLPAQPMASAPPAWTQLAVAAGAEVSAPFTALQDGPGTNSLLSHMGSSYLDADAILESCPSRETFLLPEDLEEAPLPGQYPSSTHSQLPPLPLSQSAQAAGQASRTPACHRTPLSTALAGMHRTAGQHSSSTSTWAKLGAGSGSNSSTGSSSIRPPAHSPLVSARTVAALMAGEDELQHTNPMDFLQLDNSMEGPCDLWAAAAAAPLPQPLDPPAGEPALHGFTPLQQQQQQQHPSTGAGLAGAAVGPAHLAGEGPGAALSAAACSGLHDEPGNAAAGWPPTAAGQQPAQLQQQQQQLQLYYQQQQQQRQLHVDRQLHAQLLQQRSHSFSSSIGPHNPRMQHPAALQTTRTHHTAQQQPHLHLQQQQQQQLLLHQRALAQQQYQQECYLQHQQQHLQHPRPVRAGWEAMVRSAAPPPQVTMTHPAAAAAAATLPPGGVTHHPAAAGAAAAAGLESMVAAEAAAAGSDAGAAAAFWSTWGSSSSNMIAGADHAEAAAAAAATTATGGAAAGGLPQQQQQQHLSELPTLRTSASVSSEAASWQQAAAAAAGASSSHTAELQRDLLPAAVAAAAGAGAGAGATSIAGSTEGGYNISSFQPVPAPTTVNGAATRADQQEAPSADLAGTAGATAAVAAAAAAANAAAVNAAGGGAAGGGAGGSGAGVLSTATSGSLGDSSHDSSQTQQQDIGSVEATGAAAAAAAGAGVQGLTGAAAGGVVEKGVGASPPPPAGAAAAGGGGDGVGEGVAQPRQFHHKGGGPCDHCGVMESPQWRRGPPAKPILCNACGTRYRRTHHLGPPIPSAGRIGGPKAGAAARGGSSTTSSSSSGSSTPGRKRSAGLDVPPPLPVNFEGGVHTGTRQARNPRGPNKQQKRG